MASIIHRDCERECRECGEWKHFSRFNTWWCKRSLTQRFRPDCSDCEQKRRNKLKNKDRALWIMKERARDYATRYGLTAKFVWINMNWRALVPLLRAMMTTEGICLSCGHKFVNERDIQIEHRSPLQNRTDYARMHARNLGFSCGSCNRRKSDEAYDEWLNKQEEARLSNQANPTYKQETQLLLI